MRKLPLFIAALLTAGPMGALAGDGVGPVASYVFCARNAGYCETSAPAVIDASAFNRNVLQRVNRTVNRAMRFRPDNGDTWSINVRYGDCEDFALAKRAALIRDGFPAGALHIGVGHLPDGRAHAVLIARLADGDIVLDNLRDDVLALQDASIELVAVTGASLIDWRESL